MLYKTQKTLENCSTDKSIAYALRCVSEDDNVVGLQIKADTIYKDILEQQKIQDEEIDKEIVSKIFDNCEIQNIDIDQVESEKEKYNKLYTYVLKMCNKIAYNTRRGAANFIISSPKAYEDLKNIPSDSKEIFENHMILGRFTIHQSDRIKHKDFIMGWCGKTDGDCGIVIVEHASLKNKVLHFPEGWEKYYMIGKIQ